MGPGGATDRSERATLEPRRLAGHPADQSADAVHRMAARRRDPDRRDSDGIGRQPPHERHRQYRHGPVAGRPRLPNLWLGRSWLQRQQQYHAAGRQRADRLHLYAQYHPARSIGGLSRPLSRYGADRPHRLGPAAVGDLWRELPLHDLLRPGELSVVEGQQGQWLRLPDALWRVIHSVYRRGIDATTRALYLGPRYRSTARSEQLHVHAFHDLYIR